MSLVQERDHVPFELLGGHPTLGEEPSLTEAKFAEPVGRRQVAGGVDGQRDVLELPVATKSATRA